MYDGTLFFLIVLSFLACWFLSSLSLIIRKYSILGSIVTLLASLAFTVWMPHYNTADLHDAFWGDGVGNHMTVYNTICVYGSPFIKLLGGIAFGVGHLYELFAFVNLFLNLDLEPKSK